MFPVTVLGFAEPPLSRYKLTKVALGSPLVVPIVMDCAFVEFIVTVPPDALKRLPSATEKSP